MHDVLLTLTAWIGLSLITSGLLSMLLTRAKRAAS